MDNELAKALNVDLNDPKEQFYLALHRKNSERKYLLLDIRKLHRADEPSYFGNIYCVECEQLYPRNPAQGFREIPVWPSEYMVILEDMKPRVWRRVYYRMRHEDSPVETVIKYQDYFRPVDIPNEITKRDRIV